VQTTAMKVTIERFFMKSPVKWCRDRA